MMKNFHLKVASWRRGLLFQVPKKELHVVATRHKWHQQSRFYDHSSALVSMAPPLGQEEPLFETRKAAKLRMLMLWQSKMALFPCFFQVSSLIGGHMAVQNCWWKGSCRQLQCAWTLLKAPYVVNMTTTNQRHRTVAQVWGDPGRCSIKARPGNQHRATGDVSFWNTFIICFLLNSGSISMRFFLCNLLFFSEIPKDIFLYP